MHLLWRILNIVMGSLFVFAAALQYNDPSPLRWMAIYLAAALPCVLAITGRLNLPLPAIVGGVSLAWTVTYLIRGVPTVSPQHMFDEWEMKSQQVVETRELFGLLIIGAWMLVLVLAAWRSGRKSAVAGG